MTTILYPDVMIDLETMGTRPNSPIVQIGAQAFNLASRTVGPTKHIHIAPKFGPDFMPEWNTVKFWLGQSQAARDTITATEGVQTFHGLNALSKFLSANTTGERKVWAMPPMFDLTILESAYQSMGLFAPWRYDAGRDVRTLFALAGIIREDRIPAAIPHNAASDCEAQILTCFKAMDRIEESYRNGTVGSTNPEPCDTVGQE